MTVDRENAVCFHDYCVKSPYSDIRFIFLNFSINADRLYAGTPKDGRCY